MDLINHTPSDQNSIPTLIQDDGFGKIFYKDDQQYQTPEIAHIFRIQTPLIDGSAKAKAFCDLYIKAASDQLFPVVSAATMAGSKVTIQEDNLSLLISINGYSNQSSQLVDEIFNGIKKVHPTREQFQIYKHSIASNYENAAKELPILQSFELLSNIIFNNAPMSEAKLEALEKLTYEDFLEFNHQLLKKAYFEGLLYGNLTETDAKQLWTTIKGKLKSSPYPKEEHKNREILILPQGQGPYMVTQATHMQGNAAVLLIEQGPYSFEKRASQQILGKVLKDGFFDTLRTKQQTAYIARAWEKEEERQLLQFFAVQSSSHKPSELIARFELFIENFLKQFSTKFPYERFETVRSMAIHTLQMPPENLAFMSTRLFLLGFEYDADFQLIEKRISSLRTLTYGEMQEAANEFLSRHNTRRIAILTEGVTPKDREFDYKTVTKEDLQMEGTFVAWR